MSRRGNSIKASSDRGPSLVAESQPKRLHSLLLLPLAVCLFAVGLFAGNAMVSLTRPLPPAASIYQMSGADLPLPPDMIPALYLYRADGHLIGTTGAGFVTVTLTPETRDTANRLILAGRVAWADSYLLPASRAGIRTELRLTGDHPRTIAIDNLFDNPTLPADLFQFILIMIRPPDVNSAPITPDGIRLRLIDPGIFPPKAPTKTLPGTLDATLLRTKDGVLFSPTQITAFMPALPELQQLDYPNNQALVKVGSETLRLVWIAQFSDWLAGKMTP